LGLHPVESRASRSFAALECVALDESIDELEHLTALGGRELLDFAEPASEPEILRRSTTTVRFLGPAK
jgi:hypothetical protein